MRRQAVLQFMSGITPAPATPAPTQSVVVPTTPKPTPSPALVAQAAAEGVTLAQLLALTPDQLAHLQMLLSSGQA